MAKNDQKYQISLKTMVKRRVIKFGGAWNYILVLKIWYHRQISNFGRQISKFGDDISFGHYDMKFGGKSQNGKKSPKIPGFVKNYWPRGQK